MKIELRNYQEEGYKALKKCYRGILRAPAGAGKTIIGSAALETYREKKIFWMANTIDQCAQARKALKLFDLEATVKCASHTLLEKPLDFDVMVVDECHHAASPLWSSIIKKVDPEVLWGMSATPYSDDPDHRRAMDSIFREVVYWIDRKTLEGQGFLTKGSVVMIDYPVEEGLSEKLEEAAAKQLKETSVKKMKWVCSPKTWGKLENYTFVPELYPFVKRANRLWNRDKQLIQDNPEKFKQQMSQRDKDYLNGRWSDYLDKQYSKILFRMVVDKFIYDNQVRDAIVVEGASRHVDQLDSVIVLVGKKEHGNRFAKRINSSFFLHSGIAKKLREKVIDEFREGKIKCLIATSLADEGLDVPRANVIFLVYTGKSATKLEQRTGRVLRTFEEKEKGVIYDFMDKGDPYLENHSKKRISVYRDLGYDINHINYQDL